MQEQISADNQRAYKGLEGLAELTRDAARLGPAEGDRRPFYVAWGLLAAAERQAAAIVLLHRNGLGHEAAPNRRALLEHMAQIKWLAEDGADAVDSMNRALQQSQKRLREAADAAGMTYDPTIADLVAAAVIPPNSAEQFNRFRPLFKRLGDVFPAVWTAETQLAHPTLTAAQCFFDDTAPDAVTLYREPVYRQGAENPTERSPFIAFVVMWSTMHAFNQLLPGQPWSDELQRIAGEGGIDDSWTASVQ
ncbi:DUF5677 domain-containing protein [Streptomyces sp. NPDC087437]|uniref:DUF5677 domain-containing protein n=1 Tax=Streptomyces sp. NPDC087437 TaxID=3365789 RepID=UPI00382B2BB7